MAKIALWLNVDAAHHRNAAEVTYVYPIQAKEGSDNLLYCYCQGNGFVKVFLGLQFYLNYLLGIGDYQCKEVTQEFFDSDDFEGFVLKEF